MKTFIIDWPVLMFLGVLFGGLAPTDDPWRSRALKVGGVVAVVFTATAFISYFVAPEWMWMYFISPDSVAWSLPLIAVGYVVTFLLGFAAALGLRTLGTGYLVAGAVSMLISEIAVVGVTWDRYRLVGTTDEWLSGSAHSLFAVPPQGPVKLIGALGPVFVVTLLGGIFVTWRARRAVAADR
jgi:hypothetical protein